MTKDRAIKLGPVLSLIGGRMKSILWSLVQASTFSARLSLGWATPKGTYQWWCL